MKNRPYCKNENCGYYKGGCGSPIPVALDDRGRCKNQDTVKDARDRKAKREAQQLAFARAGA